LKNRSLNGRGSIGNSRGSVRAGGAKTKLKTPIPAEAVMGVSSDEEQLRYGYRAVFFAAFLVAFFAPFFVAFLVTFLAVFFTAFLVAFFVAFFVAIVNSDSLFQTIWYCFVLL
jgi:hypothetical protein